MLRRDSYNRFISSNGLNVADDVPLPNTQRKVLTSNSYIITVERDKASRVGDEVMYGMYEDKYPHYLMTAFMAPYLDWPEESLVYDSDEWVNFADSLVNSGQRDMLTDFLERLSYALDEWYFGDEDDEDDYDDDVRFYPQSYQHKQGGRQYFDRYDDKLTEEELKQLEEYCKSDTIVFHLDDPSTEMLKPIYEGQNWDVFTDSAYRYKEKFFEELIRRHDKIMCLGHGTPSGLIGGIIDSLSADWLRDKKVFALWCYAATFFKRNGFKGQGIFCSDNCPSEVWECEYACNANVSAEWIKDNMYYLSDCIKGVLSDIWDNPEEACRKAKEAYSKAKATTEDEKKVVEFNTNTLQVV